MKKEQRIRLTFRIIAGIILLAAIPPLLFGVGTFSDAKKIQEGVPVTGEVVEVIESRASDGTRLFSPRIRYEDHEGTRHAFTGSSTRTSDKYSVGDQFEVVYHPKNPEEVRPRKFFYIWLAPAIGFGVAGAIALFSLFIAFVGPWLFVRISSAIRTTEPNGQQDAVGNEGHRGAN